MDMKNINWESNLYISQQQNPSKSKFSGLIVNLMPIPAQGVT